MKMGKEKSLSYIMMVKQLQERYCFLYLTYILVFGSSETNMDTVVPLYLGILLGARNSIPPNTFKGL